MYTIKGFTFKNNKCFTYQSYKIESIFSNFHGRFFISHSFHTSIIIKAENENLPAYQENRLEILKDTPTLPTLTNQQLANLQEGISQLKKLKEQNTEQEQQEAIDLLKDFGINISDFKEAFPNYENTSTNNTNSTLDTYKTRSIEEPTDLNLNNNIIHPYHLKPTQIISIITKIISKLTSDQSNDTYNIDSYKKINISRVVSKILNNEDLEPTNIESIAESALLEELNRTFAESISDITIVQIWDLGISIKEKLDITISPNWSRFGTSAASVISYGLILRTYNKHIHNSPISNLHNLHTRETIKASREVGRVVLFALVLPLMFMTFKGIHRPSYVNVNLGGIETNSNINTNNINNQNNNNNNKQGFGFGLIIILKKFKSLKLSWFLGGILIAIALGWYIGGFNSMLYIIKTIYPILIDIFNIVIKYLYIYADYVLLSAYSLVVSLNIFTLFFIYKKKIGESINISKNIFIPNIITTFVKEINSLNIHELNSLQKNSKQEIVIYTVIFSVYYTIKYYHTILALFF